MPFELKTYLARIRLGAVPPGAAGLAAVQQAQMQAIPFENIDPLLGILPDPGLPAIWRKLVLEHRGGYCFELNGLIGAALRALGHEPVPILGRVRMGAPEGGPRTHLAWIVTLEEGAFLVDAGFGGPGATAPIRLDVGGEQVIGNGRFRVAPDALSGERVIEAANGPDWLALYGFDVAPVTPADLVAANFLCATWPQAPFRNNLMLARSTPGGRVSAFNLLGRTVREDTDENWEIGSQSELARRLADDFGLAAAVRHVPYIWKRIAPRARRAA